MPIVTALNGEPQVTDDGDIVYVFPDLQVSASASPQLGGGNEALAVSQQARERQLLRRAGLGPNASASEIKLLLDYNRVSTRGALERSDLIQILESAMPPPTGEEEAEIVQSDPTVLQEREWKFSLASDLNKFLAGGLGAVNLGGALYLGSMLNQYALYGIRLPAFYGTVQTFYPLLLGYAVLFNVIPLARNFWIKQENVKIERRNRGRRKWQSAVANLGRDSRTRIGRKLQAARRWGKKVRQLGASEDDIVFDTSQPFEKTQMQKEEQKLRDFDSKLLNEDGDGGGSFE